MEEKIKELENKVESLEDKIEELESDLEEAIKRRDSLQECVNDVYDNVRYWENK